MSSLKEFFMMEGRSSYFTLEPESNGQGRLLSWERVSYLGPDDGERDPEDETSYEVVARGDIEKLLAALREAAAVSPEQEEEIRSGFERAVEDGGEAVVFDERRGVDATAKVGRGDGGRDDAEYDYDEDNPDRYF